MGYTVKDLLESNRFPEMHLISGSAGIDREIKKPRFIEVEDMEKTIDRIGDFTYLEYTKDVMQIMTDIRKQWGMTYPEEEK